MDPNSFIFNRSPEEIDQLAYFEAVFSGFDRACHAVGRTIDRFYDIGGYTVRLSFAGHELVAHLTPALAHLETDSSSQPSLTICIWDSVSTQTKMPLLVASLIDLLQFKWWDLLGSRFEIKGYHGDRIRTAFHLGPNILSLLDIHKNLAIYWIHDASQTPYYERGSPFKTILNWWMGMHRLMYVHAGAVGMSTGGVLLAGRGGVGKSTTALTCIESELMYASDDYCLVGNDAMPYIYSLYNTVKLRGDEDIEKFPYLISMIHNPNRTGDDKIMIFLQDHYPRRVAKGFPFKAILLPHITGESDTRLQPVTPAMALKSLAPSTLLQLPGSGQESFHEMSRLVKKVPCFILELGTNLSRIPEVIRQLLFKEASL